MATFSERYGYIKLADALIREKITPEIQNAICSCYDRLFVSHNQLYINLERYLWTHFLNKRQSLFGDSTQFKIVATTIIEDESTLWYEKLDMIESTIKYLYEICKINQSDLFLYNIKEAFVIDLNNEFKRLNFAYRIVDKEVVEVSSEEEIVAIETALKDSRGNIKFHIDEALHLYSIKPVGDYRNSIKESISAVEAFCREKTGEVSLGKALNKLEKNKIIIPKLLKNAFEKLYAYTNQPENGIRHALMDDEGTYKPTEAEALFMLVSCCAFINYLNKKVSIE